MFIFKPVFSCSSFTLVKSIFSSSTISAIRVVSSPYLRWLIFVPAILIPACDSFSLEFHLMHSAYKLNKHGGNIQFSSVQLLSLVQLFVTPWISASQASLSITNSWSLPKLMPIELVMPSSHLILCLPLLLLPPIPPSIRVSSNESTRHEVAKILEFQLQHQSFQWTPRTDLL